MLKYHQFLMFKFDTHSNDFSSTESRHSLQLGASGIEATSLVNPPSFGTLSLSHHGSNSNYYSSFHVRKVLSIRTCRPVKIL